jgi:hypothetical protein
LSVTALARMRRSKGQHTDLVFAKGVGSRRRSRSLATIMCGGAVLCRFRRARLSVAGYPNGSDANRTSPAALEGGEPG